MKIYIKSESGQYPEYKTPGSAGMDIAAFIEDPVILKPGERALIHTGLYAQIPEGYEIQIRARSGLALKNGISLVNGIGTVDSDYRGEIGVILINLGSEDFVINNGDRIAQMVVARYERIEIEPADNIDETMRSSAGFGSTGVR